MYTPTDLVTIIAAAIVGNVSGLGRLR